MLNERPDMGNAMQNVLLYTNLLITTASLGLFHFFFINVNDGIWILRLSGVKIPQYYRPS